jgi:hypothetical protein
VNPRLAKLLLAVAVVVPLLVGVHGCASTTEPVMVPPGAHECLPGFSQPALELWSRLDQVTLQEGRGWARRVTRPPGTYEALLALRNELAAALGEDPAEDRRDSPPADAPPEIIGLCKQLLEILRDDRATGAHSQPQDPGWLGRPVDPYAWNTASRLLRSAKEALDM